MDNKYLCSGFYVCLENEQLTLKIEGSPEGDKVTLSNGESTIIDNIWATPDVDILIPGVVVRCQNEYLIDFRKGMLILKKPSGEILNFRKID